MPNSPLPPKQHDQLRAAAQSEWRRIFLHAATAGSDAAHVSPVLSLYHRAHTLKVVLLLGALGVLSVGVTVSLVREQAWGDASLVGMLAVASLTYAIRLFVEWRRASRTSSVRDPAV